MINAILTSPLMQNSSGNRKIKSSKTSANTNVMATEDGFVHNNPKLNLKKAIKEGSVTYTKPTILLGINLRKGFYTYTPKRGETLAQIKRKFGIADNVISSLNAMYDDDYCPGNDNKTVIFRLNN